jgi:hypothetical protein
MVMAVPGTVLMSLSTIIVAINAPTPRRQSLAD